MPRHLMVGSLLAAGSACVWVAAIQPSALAAVSADRAGGTDIPNRISAAVGSPDTGRFTPSAEDAFYDFEPGQWQAEKVAAAHRDGDLLWTGEPASGPRQKLVARKLPTGDIRVPVDPVSGESNATGRVIVKFADWTQISAPRVAAPMLLAGDGVDLKSVERVLSATGSTVRQWLDRSPEELRQLTSRAEAFSGRPQPDLATLLSVEPAPGMLLSAAQALNDLDFVEWVEIERWVVQTDDGPFPRCPGCGICDTPCNGSDLITLPDGGLCGGNPDPGAQGEPRTFERFGCADAQCCALVGSILPTCTDLDSGRGWDSLCAAIANLVCEGTIYDTLHPSLPPPARYDPCLVNDTFAEFRSWLSGDCFQARPGQPGPGAGTPRSRGCNQPECCAAVCAADPMCCVLGWDEMCVETAKQMSPQCTIAADSSLPANQVATPDFTARLELVQEPTLFGPRPALRARGLQAYTVGAPVLGWQRYVEVPNPPYAPGLEFLESGFRGWGLDIDQMREFAREEAKQAGDPDAAVLDGEGVRVAVFDLGCDVDHEEFVCAAQVPGDPFGACLETYAVPRVIPEPGQTQISLPGVNPSHGTACLAMLVAGDNGFGVTGIARSAQGYFFPIASQQEGFRLGAAIVSMLEVFEAGDVAVFPVALSPDGGVGPNESPSQPLVTSPQWWTLIRLASDLGIASFVSAGNSCSPVGVEAGPDGVRSGALVVGAANPGAFREVSPIGCGATLSPYSAAPGPFSRRQNSNWFGGEDESGVVDVFAWGSSIVTAGGLQDLFRGAVPPGSSAANRAYTDTFGGTSASASMVAGAAAILQGFSKQRYGISMQPERLGRAMRNNGLPQAGRSYANTFGFPGSEVPCSVDWIIGGTVHRIGQNEFGSGVFPQMVPAAADIMFNGGPCDVEEVLPEPADLPIVISPAGQIDVAEIEVVLNAGPCSWYAFTAADWIDISTPTGSGATGDNIVVFDVELNDTGADRTADIVIVAGPPDNPVQTLIPVLQNAQESEVQTYVVHTGEEISTPGDARLEAQDGIVVQITPEPVITAQQVAGLTYPYGGPATDLEVDLIYCDFDPAVPGGNVNGLGVFHAAWANEVGVIRFVYVLNRNTGQYQQLGGDFLDAVPPADPVLYALPLGQSAAPFVDAKTGEVTVRIFTSGLSANAGKYVLNHDLVRVCVPIQGPPTGGG